MRFVIIIFASIITATAITLALLMAWPFIKYSRPHWPYIASPELLIQECKDLATNNKTGAIPLKSWPESVRALNPKQVIASEHDYVEIIISTGGISTRASYVVFTDLNNRTNFSMAEVKLHKTEHSAIYKLY